MYITTAVRRRDPLVSLFNDFFNESFAIAPWSRAAQAPSTGAQAAPVARARMDVIDKGTGYEVVVDLPGVKREDINVSVEGTRVAISANSKSESETKDGEVLHSERWATSYARTFELPAEVNDAGAEAKFDNGVLKLALPKRAPQVSKRLAIQ